MKDVLDEIEDIIYRSYPFVRVERYGIAGGVNIIINFYYYGQIYGIKRCVLYRLISDKNYIQELKDDILEDIHYTIRNTRREKFIKKMEYNY